MITFIRGGTAVGAIACPPDMVRAALREPAMVPDRSDDGGGGGCGGMRTACFRIQLLREAAWNLLAQSPKP